MAEFSDGAKAEIATRSGKGLTVDRTGKWTEYKTLTEHL